MSTPRRPRNRYSPKPEPENKVKDAIKKGANAVKWGAVLGASGSLINDNSRQPGELQIKERIGEDPFGNGSGHIYSGEYTYVPDGSVFPEQMAQNAGEWGVKGAAAFLAVHAGGEIYRHFKKRHLNRIQFKDIK